LNPVARALWFIEAHFAEELDLDAIAAASGVSRFHLSRAFGYATGLSLMRYLRLRRLAVAARTLAGGAPDILAVALEAGYGSHEAFTRAFRDQFGLTPEAVRDRGHLDNLVTLEPLRMAETRIAIEPPRFLEGKPLLIAGIGARCTEESVAGIPAQWQRFVPHLGHIAGQVGNATYGVCCNGDDAGNYEYVCGVEVDDFAGIPKDWSRVRVPAQRYAVFNHRDHVSGIRATWHAIWNQWLPESGHQVVDAPFLERYGEEFDGVTGRGGCEIWLPVKAARQR
jgi:AraC family transcriptional regulator